jgi:hypothetical protein
LFFFFRLQCGRQRRRRNQDGSAKNNLQAFFHESKSRGRVAGNPVAGNPVSGNRQIVTLEKYKI